VITRRGRKTNKQRDREREREESVNNEARHVSKKKKSEAQQPADSKNGKDGTSTVPRGVNKVESQIMRTRNTGQQIREGRKRTIHGGLHSSTLL
jgi:hypothetical protein